MNRSQLDWMARRQAATRKFQVLTAVISLIAIALAAAPALGNAIPVGHFARVSVFGETGFHFFTTRFTYQESEPPGFTSFFGLEPFERTTSGSTLLAAGLSASSQAGQNSFLTLDGAGNLLSYQGLSSIHGEASVPAEVFFRGQPTNASATGTGNSSSQLTFDVTRAGYLYEITFSSSLPPSSR